MKKLIITLLLALCTVLVQGQCDPDRRFAPSASIELTSDWGFIAQGGITGQLSPVSAHIGLRARQFVDSATKAGIPQPKLFPRLELGYRIINGLHVNVGLGRVYDASITAYKRLGEKTAFYGRAMYDGGIVLGMGVKFIFQ